MATHTVAISPIDDLLTLGEKTVMLTLTPNTNYQVVAIGQSANITIRDNDVLGLLVSTNTVRVAEETSTDFTVRLNGPVSGPGVRVTFARSGGDTDLQPTGTTNLRFRLGDWFIPQPLTISANTDADSINGTATFTLSPDGGLGLVTITAIEMDKTAAPEMVSIISPTNEVKKLQLFGYPGSNYVAEATSFLVQPAASFDSLDTHRDECC